jgi:lipopolysaccharide export system protein LptA
MTRLLRGFGLVVMLAAGLLFAAAAPAQDLLADNRDLPIEIEADSLEVQQEDQLAIFAGNVEARQGTIRLNADVLRVHYFEANTGAEAQSIQRIEAEGSVFFSTAEQTARGNQGIYDVEFGVITLSGGVILTQGENIIRGQRLVLNLETGESTVDAGEGGGRVHGLFVPERAPR